MNETNSEKEWRLGRIISTDGRTAKIQHMKKKDENTIPTMKIAHRSLRDISLILSEQEVALNSNEYRSKLNIN